MLQHSTLELAKHDDTVGAPERDHVGAAPENRRDHEALQAAPQAGVELAFGDAVPERLATSETSRSLNTAGRPSVLNLSRISPRLTIILIAIAVAAIIGAAIGTGIGLGLRKRSITESPVTATASTITRTKNQISPTPISPPLPSQNRILDDTSISALTLPNGDRRLFFQDFSGLIRQAFYSSTTRQWRADTGIIVASDARNHTPISAINVPTTANNASDPSSNIPSIPGGLSIFYIRQNNSLACSQFSSGAWSEESAIYFVDISKYTAALDSRHLAITVLPGKPVRLLNAFLVYESYNDDIVMLDGTLNIPPSLISFPFWTWENASKTLYASIQKSDLQFGAPFTVYRGEVFVFSAKNSDGSPSNKALYTDLTGNNAQARTVSFKQSNGTYVAQSSYTSLSGTKSGLNTYNFTETFDSTSIQKSDIIAASNNAADTFFRGYGLWVNGTQPAQFEIGIDASQASLLPFLPRTRFPFTRLTSFSPENSSKIFLYHQLNASTFAEDQWDSSIGGWLAGSIDIVTN